MNIFLILFLSSCIAPTDNNFLVKSLSRSSFNSHYIGRIEKLYSEDVNLREEGDIYILSTKTRDYELTLPKEYLYFETGDSVRVTESKRITTQKGYQRLVVKKANLIHRSEASHKKKKGKIIKTLGLIISTNIRNYDSPEVYKNFIKLLNSFKDKVSTATFGVVQSVDLQFELVSIKDDVVESSRIERRDKAYDILKNKGINPDTYDHIIHLGDTDTGLNYGTIGNVDNPGRDIYINTLGDISNDIPLSKNRTLFHEFGHNFGMRHAHTWGPRLTDFGGEIISSGDYSSIMGRYSCLKLNFISYNGSNVERVFLGDGDPNIYIIPPSSSNEYSIEVLNSIKDTPLKKILKFRSTVFNKAEGQNEFSDFTISYMRQCSQSGTGAHNILIHQQSERRTFLIKELKPGDKLSLPDFDIEFLNVIDLDSARIKVSYKQ